MHCRFVVWCVMKSFVHFSFQTFLFPPFALKFRSASLFHRRPMWLIKVHVAGEGTSVTIIKFRAISASDKKEIDQRWEACNDLIFVYRSLRSFPLKSLPIRFFSPPKRAASQRPKANTWIKDAPTRIRLEIYFYDFKRVIIWLPSVVYNSKSNHKQPTINFPSTSCRIEFHKTFHSSVRTSEE